MTINRIQFQPGLSMPEFLKLYGTEEQCAATLEQARWPKGFCCPNCSEATYSRVRGRTQILAFVALREQVAENTAAFLLVAAQPDGGTYNPFLSKCK